MCFSESERDPRYVGLIGNKTREKGWGNGKKYHGLKAELVYLSVCVCVCVCVCACACFCVLMCVRNINGVDIIAIIFKAYKTCKYPVKKGF